MIRADTVRYLTSLNTKHLEAIAEHSGYHGDRYSSAEFLGMTNGGEFCYKISFVEDGRRNQGKVFVKYDPTRDKATLDY